MIAKITPLIRLPASADVFDYFVPDDLAAVRAGQLVKIPFRSSKVLGVVLGLSKTQESTRFRARPIDSIIEEEPALTGAQLRLIGKFSRYYFVTPGSVARMMVPDHPERMSRRKPMRYPDIRFTVSRTQLDALAAAAQRIPRARYVRIQDVSSFVWLLLYLMTHSKQSQLLALVPTIEMISAIAGSVQKKCSDKLAVIHSGLSKGAYWSEYQKIRRGAARAILSTRQGVFLPIQRNSQIIFFDSTSEDFKQYDQRPRYDARIVGTWLANVTASRLLFASSSEILSEKQTAPLALPASRNARMTTTLLDMKNEMIRKDFSIIAGQTLEAMHDALKKKEKVVVIALREESEKVGDPPKRRGVSVESLLEVLTQEFKNCKVRGSSNDFDVLVTTPGTLEGLKLSSERRNIGLLIFASIEPLLAIPDYRSGERAYYRLKHWHMLAQELGFKRIILQTYSPDSLAVKAFAYGEFETFKNEELAARRELGYPPFSKLIKLSYPGKDATAPNRLKKELAARIFVHGPFTDSSKRQSLLIKLFDTVALPELARLGSDWIIDRDPENVL